MSVDENPLAEQTEYEIVRSDTPVSVDGYKLGEPMAISCVYCGTRMFLTPDPSPGLWEENHKRDCPNAGETS